MKNLSLVDNNWIERVNPNITNEERVIIEDVSENNKVLRKTTIEHIRSRSTVEASTTDAAAAQALYDQHKLANSTLIAIDVTLPNGHGIINCRVDGEHKQIRF